MYEPGYWIRDISGRIKKLRDEAVTPELLIDHVEMLEERYAEELSEIREKPQIYALSDFFGEEFFETKKVVYVPL